MSEDCRIIVGCECHLKYRQSKIAFYKTFFMNIAREIKCKCNFTSRNKFSKKRFYFVLRFKTFKLQFSFRKVFRNTSRCFSQPRFKDFILMRNYQMKQVNTLNKTQFFQSTSGFYNIGCVILVNDIISWIYSLIDMRL